VGVTQSEQTYLNVCNQAAGIVLDLHPDCNVER